MESLNPLGESPFETLRAHVRAALRSTPSNPAESLARFGEWLVGHWGLCDRFTRYGMRFYVAARMRPGLAAPLTPLQRTICNRIGTGSTRKEVAYDLGVTCGAINNTLERARAILGLSSQLELVSFFSPTGIRRRLSYLELDGATLLVGATPLRDVALWSLLSAAECEIAELILEGARTARIADLRGTSPETVTKQITSIFCKLGARSRSELAARVGSSAATSPGITHH